MTTKYYGVLLPKSFRILFLLSCIASFVLASWKSLEFGGKRQYKTGGTVDNAGAGLGAQVLLDSIVSGDIPIPPGGDFGYSGIRNDYSGPPTPKSRIYERCQATGRCPRGDSSYDLKEAQWEYTQSTFREGESQPASVWLDFENWEAGTAGLSHNPTYLSSHKDANPPRFNSFSPELEAGLLPPLFLNHTCTVTFDTDLIRMQVACDPIPFAPNVTLSLPVNVTEARSFLHAYSDPGSTMKGTYTVGGKTYRWNWRVKDAFSSAIRGGEWDTKYGAGHTDDPSDISNPLPDYDDQLLGLYDGWADVDDLSSLPDHVMWTSVGIPYRDVIVPYPGWSWLQHYKPSPSDEDANVYSVCNDPDPSVATPLEPEDPLYPPDGMIGHVAGTPGAFECDAFGSIQTGYITSFPGLHMASYAPRATDSLIWDLDRVEADNGKGWGAPVAIFHFESIFLGPTVKIVTKGALPLVIMSRSSTVIDTRIDVRPSTLGGFPGGRGPLLTHTNTLGPGAPATRFYTFTVSLGTTPVREIQEFAIGCARGQNLAGTFYFSLNGRRSGEIPANAEGTDVANMLMETYPLLGKIRVVRLELPSEGSDNSIYDPLSGVTDPWGLGIEAASHPLLVAHSLAAPSYLSSYTASYPGGGYVYRIIYLTAIGDLPELTLHTDRLKGIGKGGVFNTIVNGEEIGGTFTMSWKGVQTPPIPARVTEEELTSLLLNAWSEHGVSHVRVTQSNPKGEIPRCQSTHPYPWMRGPRDPVGSASGGAGIHPDAGAGEDGGTYPIYLRDGMRTPGSTATTILDYAPQDLPPNFNPYDSPDHVHILSTDHNVAIDIELHKLGIGEGDLGGAGSGGAGSLYSHCVNGPGPGWGKVYSVQLMTIDDVPEDLYPTSTKLLWRGHETHQFLRNEVHDDFDDWNPLLEHAIITEKYPSGHTASAWTEEEISQQVLGTGTGARRGKHASLDPDQPAQPLLGGVKGGRGAVAAAASLLPIFVTAQDSLIANPPEFVTADSSGLTGVGAFAYITLGHWTSEHTALPSHPWLRIGDSYSNANEVIESGIRANATLYSLGLSPLLVDSATADEAETKYRFGFGQALPPHSGPALSVDTDGDSIPDAVTPAEEVLGLGRLFHGGAMVDTSPWLTTAALGGGGGSHGGRGGLGHGPVSSKEPLLQSMAHSQTGRLMWNGDTQNFAGGSGGAVGGASLSELFVHSDSSSGAGGAGGGVVGILAVGDLVLGPHSALTADGEDGEMAFRGGGGGSGGRIVLTAGGTITVRGTIRAAGGDGGRGSGLGGRGGGGGSGGVILSFSQSVDIVDGGGIWAPGGRGGEDEYITSNAGGSMPDRVHAKYNREGYISRQDAVQGEAPYPLPSQVLINHPTYNGVPRLYPSHIDGEDGAMLLFSADMASWSVAADVGGAEDTRRALRVSSSATGPTLVYSAFFDDEAIENTIVGRGGMFPGGSMGTNSYGTSAQSTLDGSRRVYVPHVHQGPSIQLLPAHDPLFPLLLSWSKRVKEAIDMQIDPTSTHATGWPTIDWLEAVLSAADGSEIGLPVLPPIPPAIQQHLVGGVLHRGDWQVRRGLDTLFTSNVATEIKVEVTATSERDRQLRIHVDSSMFPPTIISGPSYLVNTVDTQTNTDSYTAQVIADVQGTEQSTPFGASFNPFSPIPQNSIVGESSTTGTWTWHTLTQPPLSTYHRKTPLPFTTDFPFALGPPVKSRPERITMYVRYKANASNAHKRRSAENGGCVPPSEDPTGSEGCNPLLADMGRTNGPINGGGPRVERGFHIALHDDTWDFSQAFDETSFSGISATGGLTPGTPTVEAWGSGPVPTLNTARAVLQSPWANLYSDSPIVSSGSWYDVLSTSLFTQPFQDYTLLAPSFALVCAYVRFREAITFIEDMVTLDAYETAYAQALADLNAAELALMSDLGDAGWTYTPTGTVDEDFGTSDITSSATVTKSFSYTQDTKVQLTLTEGAPPQASSTIELQSRNRWSNIRGMLQEVLHHVEAKTEEGTFVQGKLGTTLFPKSGPGSSTTPPALAPVPLPTPSTSFTIESILDLWQEDLEITGYSGGSGSGGAMGDGTTTSSGIFPVDGYKSESSNSFSLSGLIRGLSDALEALDNFHAGASSSFLPSRDFPAEVVTAMGNLMDILTPALDSSQFQTQSPRDYLTQQCLYPIRATSSSVPRHTAEVPISLPTSRGKEDERIMVGIGSINGKWVHDASYRTVPRTTHTSFHKDAPNSKHARPRRNESPILTYSQPNRWYKVDMFLNWANHTYSARIDDVALVTNAPFQGVGVTRIGLYVVGGAEVYFDQIFAGRDETLGFQCPSASPESDLPVMDRPIEHGWTRDDVVPGWTQWGMSRHYSHLSQREKYNVGDRAGMVDFEGMPHTAYVSDTLYQREAHRVMYEHYFPEDGPTKGIGRGGGTTMQVPGPFSPDDGTGLGAAEWTVPYPGVNGFLLDPYGTLSGTVPHPDVETVDFDAHQAWLHEINSSYYHHYGVTVPDSSNSDYNPYAPSDPLSRYFHDSVSTAIREENSITGDTGRGGFYAGSLLYVRGDQPGESLLYAAQSSLGGPDALYGARTSMNRGQGRTGLGVSSLDPHGPASPFSSHVMDGGFEPLDLPWTEETHGVGVFARDAMDAVAQRWAYETYFSDWQNIVQSDELNPEDRMSWGAYLALRLTQAGVGAADSVAGGDWNGGEAILSNTDERGPAGGYRGRSGRHYWYGEHDNPRHAIHVPSYNAQYTPVRIQNSASFVLPHYTGNPWWADVRPWMKGGVFMCSSGDMTVWRNGGMMLPYANVTVPMDVLGQVLLAEISKDVDLSAKLNVEIDDLSMPDYSNAYASLTEQLLSVAWDSNTIQNIWEKDTIGTYNACHDQTQFQIRLLDDANSPNPFEEGWDFIPKVPSNPITCQDDSVSPFPYPLAVQRPKVIMNLQDSKHPMYVMWMSVEATVAVAWEHGEGVEDYVTPLPFGTGPAPTQPPIPPNPAEPSPLPEHPRPIIRIRMAGVAVARHPSGPFVFAHSLRPDDDEVVDLTILQEEDTGNAYMARTFYSTTRYILPAPVMQPIWSAIYDANDEIDFSLNYHRAYYHYGYDNPEDIYMQRWRLEDIPWEIRFGNGWVETYDEVRDLFILTHTVTSEVVEYKPKDRQTNLDEYIPLHTAREVIGRGLNPIHSRYLDPALPENSDWVAQSVPAVKAQTWADNYRDKNIADNPPHPSVTDLLIAPHRVAQERRTKYIALSRLTDDYLDVIGDIHVFEGEITGPEALIALWGEGKQFGWHTDANKVRSHTRTGDVYTDQLHPLSGPAGTDDEISFPHAFSVEVDWEDRHWQYTSAINDRKLDFRNFRDRQTSAECPNIHHLARITFTICQRILNQELAIEGSTPEKNYDDVYESYYDWLDTSSYEDCLARHKELIVDYQECVRKQVPSFDDLGEPGVGDRECVGGGGICGPPETGTPPLPTYGFPAFDPADYGIPLPDSFEEDLTIVDLSSRTESIVPSYYGTSISGLPHRRRRLYNTHEQSQHHPDPYSVYTMNSSDNGTNTQTSSGATSDSLDESTSTANMEAWEIKAREESRKRRQRLENRHPNSNGGSHKQEHSSSKVRGANPFAHKKRIAEQKRNENPGSSDGSKPNFERDHKPNEPTNQGTSGSAASAGSNAFTDQEKRLFEALGRMQL